MAIFAGNSVNGEPGVWVFSPVLLSLQVTSVCGWPVPASGSVLTAVTTILKSVSSSVDRVVVLI